MEEKHKTVMFEEVIEHLNIKKNGTYVDCTFGDGGHSKGIAQKLQKGKIIAFDWDETNIDKIKNDLFFMNKKFIFINDNFSNFSYNLEKILIKKVDGVLLDLGISSNQLFSDRGFSYRLDNKLDMRISKKHQKITAEKIINDFSQKELSDIFYYYGEEKKSRKIAKKICYYRKKERIIKTQKLVSLIASCFSKKKNKHPAKKIFQALRIFINKELENISNCLKEVVDKLKKGGRILVISFHSLEDRIIKKNFKNFEKTKKFKIINKKPLTPSDLEIKKNNRSRSSKMRIIEKIL